jgi:hypothetical protein
MEKKFMRAVTYLMAFMLGAYFTSEFKFNVPIEGYRWALMSFFFVFYLTILNKNDEK